MATKDDSFLIHNEDLDIHESAFVNLNASAGIDIGNSLTKMVFLPKNSTIENGYQKIKLISVSNTDIKKGLEFVKSEAKLPSTGCINWTGIGGQQYINHIKDILKLKPNKIEEFDAFARGPYFITKYCHEKDWFYPVILDDSIQKSQNKQIVTRRKERLEMKKTIFPALVFVISSKSLMFWVDEDANYKAIGLQTCCGKTFLGLSKLLLGTNDYEEVMKMAEDGDRGNVDRQVKDMHKDNEELKLTSPEETPMLPFGKAADKRWDDDFKDKATKSDIAASLVNMFASDIFTSCSTALWTVPKETRRALISGTFTKSPIVRKMLNNCVVTTASNSIKVQCIGSAHSGAIACMLNDTVKTFDNGKTKSKGRKSLFMKT